MLTSTTLSRPDKVELQAEVLLPVLRAEVGEDRANRIVGDVEAVVPVLRALRAEIGRERADRIVSDAMRQWVRDLSINSSPNPLLERLMPKLLALPAVWLCRLTITLLLGLYLFAGMMQFLLMALTFLSLVSTHGLDRLLWASRETMDRIWNDAFPPPTHSR